MKGKKVLTVFVLMAFIFSLTACAGVPVQAGKDAEKTQKSAKQLKLEQDEETRSLLVKGISSFAGLVTGGLIGLLTSPKQSAVTSTIGGCIAGGGLGFLLGLVIFDNTKPGEQKPDDKKVKEYFQDYRNIQLKE